MIRRAGTALHNAQRQLETLSLGEPSLTRHFLTKTHSASAHSQAQVLRQDRRPVAIPSPTSKPRRRREGNDPEPPHLLPRLPRYIRRQSLSAAYDSKPPAGYEKGSSSRTVSSNPRHRSRHFKVDHAESDSPKRLLDPHVLSARLKKLCDAGKVDAAVAMLKNAPLDAQNTPVWNTLIWECMKAKRFSLAYQLFVDMKRRGFSPTTRTFQTMFSGLSRIEFWSTHPKQLANARSLYESFRRHIDSIKKHDSSNPELSNIPLTFYIKILGDAGEYQDIFDVYYALDSDGPMSPNQHIFTAMFQALSARKNAASSRKSVDYSQNASDAKLLWMQMIKASQKSAGFPVDSYITAAGISALSRGRPADQTFAFQIVREHLGLTKPGDSAPIGTMPLTPQTLAAALMLCNTTRKHSLCIHFFHQVMKRAERHGGVSIIDRAHAEEVIKAHVSLSASGGTGEAYQALQTLEWMLRQEITGPNGPKIRPATTTFNLVLMACWRSADWDSAARTFELMTGYKVDDFRDGRAFRTPRVEKRSVGRNLVPDAQVMSCMLRAALVSRDRANLRQCLRMVDHIGVDNLFGPLRTSPKRKETLSNKEAKHAAFYHSKLADALIETVDRVLTKRKDGPTEDETSRWRSLGLRAKEVLMTVSKSAWTPAFEEDPQEVADRSTDVDSFIKYEAAVRM